MREYRGRTQLCLICIVSGKELVVAIILLNCLLPCFCFEVLRPLSATAKVTLNLKFESDQNTPLVCVLTVVIFTIIMLLPSRTHLSWTFKVTVAVECERVDVDFTKAQVRMYVTYTLCTVYVRTRFHIT